MKPHHYIPTWEQFYQFKYTRRFAKELNKSKPKTKVIMGLEYILHFSPKS